MLWLNESTNKIFNHIRNVKLLGYRRYHSENVFGFKRKNGKIYEVPERMFEILNKESNFYRLVTAYRQHGHKCSDVNPVSLSKNYIAIPELDIKRYGFETNDEVSFEGIINYVKNRGSIGEAVDFLHNVYTQNVAAEFLYMEEQEEIDWLSRELEELPRIKLSPENKICLVTELLKSQCFDNFLAKKFTSLKRYGAEGAEGMMTFFSQIFKLAAEDNIEQIVLAMAHRGRLNLLTGLLNFPPAKLFSKLKGNSDFPENYHASGDVLSHSNLGYEI